MIQFLIAVDQTLNTMTWARLEGFGYADETLSARMWRLRNSSNWGRARKIVDWVFGNVFGDRNHCERSHLDEYFKYQMHETYRAPDIEIPYWYRDLRQLTSNL